MTDEALGTPTAIRNAAKHCGDEEGAAGSSGHCLAHDGIHVGTTLLAAASVTDAIAIPAMPITPPPKAARANRPDEVQEDEAREQH